MTTRFSARARFAPALALAILTIAAPWFAADAATGIDAPSTEAQAAPGKGGASKKKIQQIEERGEAVPAAVRRATELRLDGWSRQIDFEAGQQEQVLAQRLAAEFGETAQSIAKQQSSAKCSWGDFVIARTLRASCSFKITPAQIAKLHREGMSWAMVAHGLGLDVDTFVRAADAERAVALGESRADGRVARIDVASGVPTAQVDD